MPGRPFYLLWEIRTNQNNWIYFSLYTSADTPCIRVRYNFGSFFHRAYMFCPVRFPLPVLLFYSVVVLLCHSFVQDPP